MKFSRHLAAGIAVGTLGAIIPDVTLLLFGWRKDWLPNSHPLVRWHRFMHTKEGMVALFLAGYISHLLMDHYSDHREGPSDQSDTLFRWPR